MSSLAPQLTRPLRHSASADGSEASAGVEVEQAQSVAGVDFGSAASAAKHWLGRGWRAVGVVPTEKEVGFVSFVSLGAADIVGVAGHVTLVERAVEVLGVGGAVGLIVTSARDLRSAKPWQEKWDAAANLAWGQQGLVHLLPSTLALRTAITLGVAGALIQTSVGVVRMRQGLQTGDRATLTLGALDVGSGLLWLGWDLFSLQQPLFIGSFVAVRIAREGCANREAVAKLAEAARQRATRARQACKAGLDLVAGEAVRDVSDALLVLVKLSAGVSATASVARWLQGEAPAPAASVARGPRRSNGGRTARGLRS